jgi:thymidylate kinase
LAFHQRVRDGYLAMAERYGDAWCVVDGSGSEDEVVELVESRVATLAWSNV